MNFLNALSESLNHTYTTNGAVALKSTNSGLLDLYGVIGAMRNRSEQDIQVMFSQAFAENQLLAMRLLFYARDIRGGLGERRTARIIYKHLALRHPEVLKKNLSLLSDFGRWDDLLVLLDTPLLESVTTLIKEQLLIDVESDQPSLMAKWLPSINTSSAESRRRAKIIINSLGWNAKQYRQTLAFLRQKIDLLEVKMTANEWQEINYAGVPSNAMHLYSAAFARHDQERFANYMAAVKEGTESINASVLYPYNIVEKILYSNVNDNYTVLEELWNHLPDYVSGKPNSVLVMADVSGSMSGRPMATAIGLALYFAEKNQGTFAGHYMTFSEEPELVKVTGNSLYERVNEALFGNWGMNTDFEKALQIILSTAVNNRAKQSDLPETLVVVSDMQFDASISQTSDKWTFYEEMKKQYKLKGYNIPEIIFWNVNSTSNVFQTSSDYSGVKLASGQSPVVFKSILDSKALNPYDFMLEVLEDQRYEKVAV